MRTPSSTAPDFVSGRECSAYRPRGAFGRRLWVLAGLLLTLPAVGATSASAAEHTIVSGEYGKNGPASSGIGNGCRLAFQEQSQRLYLFSDNKIYALHRSGPGSVSEVGGNFPITAVRSDCSDPDFEVDNSAGTSDGNLYAVPSTQSIYGWTSAGVSLTSPFADAGGETCGVAVTASGQVWGGNYGNREVTKFSSSGASAGSIPIGYTFCKLAVDRSNGDLYVAKYDGSEIVKYTAASGYTSTMSFPSAGGNAGMAINGAEHRLYVGGNSSQVKAYDTTSGALVETIQLGGSGGSGLAVDEATDTLFVTVGSVIKEFLGVKVPKATTGEPIGNTEVSGSADPNEAGDITECYFEFGVEQEGGGYSYESTKTCAESLPITAPASVHADLGSLVGEKTYHYRLVLGTGAPGIVGRGADKTIVPHNVKGLKTEAATEVNRSTAKLNASFVGTEEETTYYFYYGSSPGYGSRVPLAPAELSAGTTSGPTSISAQISGLEGGHTYHFRVVAKNSLGTSVAKDKEFTTPPAVDSVVTEDPSDVTRTSAVLNGSFDGGTNDTPPGPLEGFHYYFEWGPTSAYGNETAVPPGVDAGPRAETVHVSAEISGLSVYLPDSQPYHFRLVVSNSTGKTVGPDHTFFTDPPALPVISDTQASGVSSSQATLAAKINPGEGDTLFRFEYGTDTSYGSSTPMSEPIGNDTSDHAVSATVDELAPGTLYHFRAVAVNFGGTSRGPDMTFVTPGAPAIEASGASAGGPTTAHLTASVVANASETDVHFEYGTSLLYGNSTGANAIGQALLSAAPVAADLTGLEPATTYHARAVASNAVGTIQGPDLVFTTSPVLGEPKPEGKPGPAKCRKGLIRRKGRCVRRHRAHRHSQKTSSGGSSHHG